MSLDRFIEAQAGTYDRALAEIRNGRKESHWMWFVFPQLAGLGHSPTARYYGIGSRAEASAYADHAILGPRLRTCVAAVRDQTARTAEAVFGSVDALKLRSSLTLFSEITGEPDHAAVIARWFAGTPDPLTLRLLATLDQETARPGVSPPSTRPRR